MFDNLSVEQKVNALLQASLLKYLADKTARFWIDTSERIVGLDDTQIGFIKWSKPVIRPVRPKSPLRVLLDICAHPTHEPAPKQYCVIDVLGQEWLGTAAPGGEGWFVKCKALPGH